MSREDDLCRLGEIAIYLEEIAEMIGDADSGLAGRLNMRRAELEDERGELVAKLKEGEK